jgi:hypothetical protein
MQDNFEKVFQTGLALPEQKQPPLEKLPKKEEKPIFVEIPIEDDPPSKQSDPIANSTIIPTSNISHNNSKKAEIKLVSVKDIKSPKQSKLPYEG